MTTLQDIMGLITKRKIKTPTDNDYIISAAYTDTQERLKPQPKMEANLLSLGAIKKYVLSGTPIGGSQTLAQTLVIGNATGGTNILLNSTDSIQLENNSSLRQGTYDFGQGGGISRVCGVDYEDMWQGGIRHVFDTNGYIRNSTNGFNIVPNFSFDDTLRFKVGSFWTLDDGTTYKCTDNSTGAAVWESYSPPSKYKVFTALLTQRGDRGDITDICAGDLEIGVTYYINNNTNGDFTNVGAPNNDNGTYFIATGTSPNTWGISALCDTLTYVLDAPTAIVLENTIGNVWFTYLNTGFYEIGSDDLFTAAKTSVIMATPHEQADPLTPRTYTTQYQQENSIYLYTFSLSPSPRDNALNQTFIEIRVYN